MQLHPTLQAPVTELLYAIAALLREGVDGWVRPDPYASPYWPGWNTTGAAREGAPAGHFLFQQGTRLYVDDMREEVRAPYCVISLTDDPQPRDQRVPSVFWDVPVTVEMAWTGDDAVAQDIRQRLVVLTGLLTSDVPAIGPDPARPAHARLSGPGHYVYGNDCIHALKQEPLRLQEGHPAIRLSFTVLCSALPPLPTGDVPDQPQDITLSAALYADRLDDFTFAQTTPGITITLAPPTDGSRKVITVANTGSTFFTLGPGGMSGGITVATGPPQTLHWDALLGAWDSGI